MSSPEFRTDRRTRKKYPMRSTTLIGTAVPNQDVTEIDITGIRQSSSGRVPIDLSGNTPLTEGQIQLLMNRMSRDAFENVFHGTQLKEEVLFPKGGFRITPEQTRKGLAWLQKNRRSLRSDDQNILDDFLEFRFVGVEDASNALGQAIGRLRIYRVIGKSGNYFDYIGQTGREVRVVERGSVFRIER